MGGGGGSHIACQILEMSMSCKSVEEIPMFPCRIKWTHNTMCYKAGKNNCIAFFSCFFLYRRSSAIMNFCMFVCVWGGGGGVIPFS